MDTTERTTSEGDAPVPAPATPPSVGVSVEHRARLAGGIALLAGVVAVAWFARALQTGSVADWCWFALVAAVGVLQLLVVRDSRAPLMLADDQGVRVRRGETWSGLRWADIDHVEVESPASWLRDGRIVVHPRAQEADEAALVTEAFTVTLAATTRLGFEGLTGDLVADLDSLAGGRTPVQVLTRLEPEASEASEGPETDETPEADERPVDVTGEEPQDEHGEQVEQEEHDDAVAVHTGVEVVVLHSTVSDDGLVLPHQVTPDERDLAETADADADTGEIEPVAPAPRATVTPAFAPLEPVRPTRPAARAEVVRDTVRAQSRPIPLQRDTDVAPVVVARVDDFAPHRPRPAAEAKIGPQIAAARHRARLSIDTLSERTRIRPHVLESLEVDDFEPCGGDFYARGHLRTLARTFGLDAGELVALYDEHYAQPEIEAKQVFEAELATGIGGGVQATFSGPRWSLLAASVIALALVWGVAHFFTEQPQELVSPAPSIDSAGLAHAQPVVTPSSTLAALAVTARGASPQVVIRDRDGQVLWAGRLAAGQRQQVVGLGPFDVTASNGAAVKVSYLGKARGTVGPSQAADSRTFG